MSFSPGIFETCSHGGGFLCSICRAETEADRKAKIKAGTHVWGVMLWRGDRNYTFTQAVKTYKSRSAAEKYAEKLNEHPHVADSSGYVVRFLKVGAL